MLKWQLMHTNFRKEMLLSFPATLLHLWLKAVADLKQSSSC